MDHSQTIALASKGRDEWNRWALDLLGQRQRLQQSKEWFEYADASGDLIAGNAVTSEWYATAEVVFSTTEHPSKYGRLNLSGYLFPGAVIFMGAEIDGDATFEGSTFYDYVEFRGTTFGGLAKFSACKLLNKVAFNNCRFLGQVLFRRTQFLNFVWFNECEFKGILDCYQMRVAGETSFQKATFNCEASFNRTQFEDAALFSCSQFHDKSDFFMAKFHGVALLDESKFRGAANFCRASFQGYTDFGESEFCSPVDFSSIHVESDFQILQVSFVDVPDFRQAHFVEAPNFEVAALPIGALNWRLALPHKKQATQLGASQRWRALRRLALQAHDHVREQTFFAEEIRSARFVDDWPFTWRLANSNSIASVARFWLGFMYQLFSNFGRSLVRPLMLWVIVFAIASAYYFQASPAAGGATLPGLGLLTERKSCYTPESVRDKGEQYVSGLAEAVRSSTSANAEAWLLSLKNAFVIVDVGSDSTHRTYGCLYGVERFGDNPMSIVPSGVAVVSTLQKAVSAIAIFFFGLAARNMLRLG